MADAKAVVTPDAKPSYELLSRRKMWFAVAICAFSNFMVVLDITIANVSVPHIAGDLGTSVDQGTWVLTSYAVAEAICVPLTGWLAQRFGVVRVFIAAMLGFGLFSFLCGMAPTMGMLVACRVGQGLCGGPIMPMSQTVIARVCRPDALPKAMAGWAMTMTLGPALGPSLGGYISDSYSWHWIFLINVPIALTISVAAFALLRRVETETRRVPIDRVGLCLMIFWIGCLQVMLDIGRDHDWFADNRVLALGIGAAVGFLVFVIWELTELHPIVDLRVFRHRGFPAVMAAQVFGFGAFFSGIVTMPQWLQLAMGYSAMDAGTVSAMHAYSSMFAAPFVARAMTKIDPRILMSGGLVWVALATMVRTVWNTDLDYNFLALTVILQGFGIAAMFIPIIAISLSLVDPAETASAAGIQNFMRTVAIAISTSMVLNIWGNSQFTARQRLVEGLHPEAAQRTLAGLGFNDAQARGYISSLVDRQAMTVALDHTFAVAVLFILFAAALVWMIPRIDPSRASNADTGGH